MSEELKQASFDVWKSEMKQRIKAWASTKDDYGFDFKADYSIVSLIEMERLLIKYFNVKSLENKENNVFLDGCVSYIGEVIIRLLPESKWHIYLDDICNVYYGMPCVLTPYSGAIAVHYLLREILTENNGKVLEDRLERVVSYDKEIRQVLRNQ